MRVIASLHSCAALALLVFCSCASAAVEIFSTSFSSCRDGRLIRVTLVRPSDPDSPRVEAYATSRAASHATALSRLMSSGESPKLLMNAGFFSQGQPASFFSSARSGRSGGYVMRLPPRTCAMTATGLAPEIFLGTPAVLAEKQKLPGAEIFCAGPRLLENGESVVTRQFCEEGFEARCRADGKDPGLGFDAKTPRAAVCIDASASLRFYTVDSPTVKCGPTLLEFTDLLIRDGCKEALNLDGGGSVKLFAQGAYPERQVLARGASPDHERAIPIWILIR